MSPGEEECVLDIAREGLWLSYVFYADRVPELYDLIEDEVFSGNNLLFKQFMESNSVSFPTKYSVNSGEFISTLSDS